MGFAKDVTQMSIWCAVETGRAHAGLISKGMEDALLCILDCISKIGMEFFAA